MEKDEFTLKETRLKVPGGFELYVQDWGNPKAKTAIIFLKGGPGGACKQRDKDGFDPARDRVIFFDQRGCGQSKPYGKLEANTTAHMIQDITAIADHFGLQKFALRGTSWGSCLALAYALEHPERVAALFVGGIFTASQKEIDWLDNGLFRTFYPDVWQKFLQDTPADFHQSPAAYHYEKVLKGTPEEIKKSAYAYACLEGGAIKLDDRFTPENFTDFDPIPMQIEMTYLANRCFLPERHILDNAHRLPMPVYIVQGRYDMVCPPETAWELHQKLPNCELYWTTAGHLVEHESVNVFKSLYGRL